MCVCIQIHLYQTTRGATRSYTKTRFHPQTASPPRGASKTLLRNNLVPRPPRYVRCERGEAGRATRSSEWLRSVFPERVVRDSTAYHRTDIHLYSSLSLPFLALPRYVRTSLYVPPLLFHMCENQRDTFVISSISSPCPRRSRYPWMLTHTLLFGPGGESPPSTSAPVLHPCTAASDC